MKITKLIITVLALAAAVGCGAQDKGHPAAQDRGGDDKGGWHDRDGDGRGPWRGGEHGEEGMGMGMMGPMSPHLLRDLKLTPEQEKKFKDQRLEVEKKKIQLHADRAMLELDLRNVLSTYPVNQGEAMKIGEKISDLEKKGVLLKVEAWSRFLSGLTAEQHRKLMDAQEEFRERQKAWHEMQGHHDEWEGGGPH